ncbi:hypothetical protein BC835DRAFT_689337 [Cytidiella melzeri]|nr:hypothetical protein BC835DRAFT_689337 [Cytidiella melzeri]
MNERLCSRRLSIEGGCQQRIIKLWMNLRNHQAPMEFAEMTTCSSEQQAYTKSSLPALDEFRRSHVFRFFYVTCKMSDRHNGRTLSGHAPRHVLQGSCRAFKAWQRHTLSGHVVCVRDAQIYAATSCEDCPPLELCRFAHPVSRRDARQYPRERAYRFCPGA